MKKIFWILGVIITLAAVLLAVRFIFGGPEDSWICGETGWIKHGNPSAPQPTTPCGSQNIQATISRDGKLSDLVEVAGPKAGDKVKSPIKISGRAPGNWFFEATAPVVLVDWDGKIISQSHITAEGEWMTTDLVNFSGEIEYTLPTDIYSKKGNLILRKDNPSGLPENDAALEIPIVFE